MKLPEAFKRWLRKHQDVDDNEAHSMREKLRLWLSDCQMFRGVAITRGSKMARDEGMDYTPGGARRRRTALKRQRTAKRSRKRNRQ